MVNSKSLTHEEQNHQQQNHRDDFYLPEFFQKEFPNLANFLNENLLSMLKKENILL
jgi:hypothetical protein